MSTSTNPVISTVTEYEDKVLELIVQVQDNVLGYVKQAVDYVDGRISEVELPFDVPRIVIPEEIPTLSEVVDTQFAFSKKLLANQEKFAKNVVKAVKPLTRDAAKTTRTPKARPAKAATAA